MKKTLLSITALFTFAIAAAQDEPVTTGFSRGDAFISGGVSFGSQSTGDNKANQITIAPKAGYFVSNNIALGVGLGYSSQKREQYDSFFGTYEVKSSVFEGGIFGRYYFTPANSFSFFTELYAAYATSKTETQGVESDPVNIFGVMFSPGFNYFVSKHFSLEASLGFLRYGTSKTDAPGAEATNSFAVGVDFSNIGLGVIYKF